MASGLSVSRLQSPAAGCHSAASLRSNSAVSVQHHGLPSAPAGLQLRGRKLVSSLIVKAEPETPVKTPSAVPESSDSSSSDNVWVSVMPPEDLPKGVRKEVKVDGNSILLFWYRNQIYAIASRSPAEGAYSEGFIKARFTQDYGIICPTTESIFSLKDGSILEWYPSNPVLRSITPKTGSLPIYPVKLTQDAIQVCLDGVVLSGPNDRGGADSALESNNVFAVEPKSYVAGSAADESDGSGLSTVATLTVAISAFGIVATAGTATALFYEDFVLLGLFWAFMLVVGGFFTYQQLQSGDNQ